MGGIIGGGGKIPQTGPSAAEQATQMRLERQQKEEEAKREQLRISLARQRFGTGVPIQQQPLDSSVLG